MPGGPGGRGVLAIGEGVVERMTRRWIARTRFRVPARLARIRTKSKRSVQTAPLRCVIGPDPLLLGSRRLRSFCAGILIRPPIVHAMHRQAGAASYRKLPLAAMWIADAPLHCHRRLIAGRLEEIGRIPRGPSGTW